MPMPRWLAKVNRRVFNPIEIRRGVRPVLIHVGRSSGTVYRTPLDAHPIDGGYVFIPNYGPRSDWVRNILAAGSARLRLGDDELALTSPEMVRKADVWPSLRPGTKTPPGIKDDSMLLQMSLLVATGSEVPPGRIELPHTV